MDGRVLLVILVAIVVIAGIAFAVARRRRGGLSIQELAPADVSRYMQEMDSIERSFVDDPGQAAARARGMVDEVTRRMGFPDRLDSKQRAKDLSGHDREAGRLMEAAGGHLQQHPDDTEKLRLAVQHYRDLLRRLLKVTSAGDARGGSSESGGVAGSA
jgi:hypothetical protein